MRSGRFVILDLYRFLFALAVALEHFHGYGATPKSYLAVDFFFVLSGFVLSAGYAGKAQRPEFFRSFLVDRVARLYPLHLAVLIVILGMNVAFYVLSNGQLLENGWAYQDGRAYTFILNALLVQGIGLTKSASWNAPSWSISVEIYVNIFLALALIKLPTARRSGMVALIALIVIAIYSLLFNSFGSLIHIGDNIFGFLNAGLLRGFAGIALGVLCYLIFAAAAGRPIGASGARWLSAAMIVLAVGTFALIEFGADIQNLDFMLVPIIFFLVLTTALYETARPVGAGFGAAFEACGALSYAVYLIHWPIVIFVSYFLVYIWKLPIDQGRPVVTAIYIATILLIAAPVHYLFELPMKRRLRIIFTSASKRLTSL